MRRPLAILATCALSLLAALGASGLRALHVAAAHASPATAERVSASEARVRCEHHGHCHESDAPTPASPEAPARGDDADCATCDLLTVLVASGTLHDATADGVTMTAQHVAEPAVRPLPGAPDATRARPPPAGCTRPS